MSSEYWLDHEEESGDGKERSILLTDLNALSLIMLQKGFIYVKVFVDFLHCFCHIIPRHSSGATTCFSSSPRNRYQASSKNSVSTIRLKLWHWDLGFTQTSNLISKGHCAAPSLSCKKIFLALKLSGHIKFSKLLSYKLSGMMPIPNGKCIGLYIQMSVLGSCTRYFPSPSHQTGIN